MNFELCRGPAGITEGVLPFAMATFQDAVMSPRATRLRLRGSRSSACPAIAVEVQDVVETEGLEDWPIDGTHPASGLQ